VARPRVVRFAGALRRLADRLSPPAPEAPAGEVKLVSRDELREIQAQGMEMAIDYFCVSRQHAQNDGLLWIPRSVLSSISWLIDLEVEVRESDFATIENEPRAALR
jgi:hypothetical protein